MRWAEAAFAGLGFVAGHAWAAPEAGPGSGLNIVLPADGDEYSQLVARAAAQDKTVDFHALRLAYLKSKSRGKVDPDPLRDALFEAAKTSDHQKTRDAAVKLLSADYIDMWGHKFLRQSCFMLHDDACAEQGKFVEFGLLRSILGTGDGKECKSGWEVVTIGEEYFMLSMVGAKLKSQSLVDGPCDRMDIVNQDGKDQSYFFRIDAVLADEAKGLGN